jgi:hypothetical protein
MIGFLCTRLFGLSHRFAPAVLGFASSVRAPLLPLSFPHAALDLLHLWYLRGALLRYPCSPLTTTRCPSKRNGTMPCMTYSRPEPTPTPSPPPAYNVLRTPSYVHSTMTVPRRREACLNSSVKQLITTRPRCHRQIASTLQCRVLRLAYACV